MGVCDVFTSDTGFLGVGERNLKTEEASPDTVKQWKSHKLLNQRGNKGNPFA